MRLDTFQTPVLPKYNRFFVFSFFLNPSSPYAKAHGTMDRFFHIARRFSRSAGLGRRRSLFFRRARRSVERQTDRYFDQSYRRRQPKALHFAVIQRAGGGI